MLTFFENYFYPLLAVNLIYKRTAGLRFPKEMSLIDSGFSSSHFLLKKEKKTKRGFR